MKPVTNELDVQLMIGKTLNIKKVVFSLREKNYKCKSNKFYEVGVEKLMTDAQIYDIKKGVLIGNFDGKVRCSLNECMTNIVLKTKVNELNHENPDIEYGYYIVEFRGGYQDIPIVISYLKSTNENFVLWICPYVNWIKNEYNASFVSRINTEKNGPADPLGKHIWTVIDEKSLISSRFFICGDIKQEASSTSSIAISVSFDYPKQLGPKSLELTDNRFFKCDGRDIFNSNENNIIYSHYTYNEGNKDAYSENRYLTNTSKLYAEQLIIVFKKYDIKTFLEEIDSTFQRYDPINYESICKVPNYQATIRLMVGNNILPIETTYTEDSGIMIIYRISNELFKSKTTSIKCQIVLDNVEDPKFYDFYSRKFNSSLYKKSTLYSNDKETLKEHEIFNLGSVNFNEVYKCVLNPPYLVGYINRPDFMIVSENYQVKRQPRDNDEFAENTVLVKDSGNGMVLKTVITAIAMFGIILIITVIIIALVIYNSYRKIIIYQPSTTNINSLTHSSSSKSLEDDVLTKNNTKTSIEKEKKVEQNDKKSNKKSNKKSKNKKSKNSKHRK
uniref:Sporozoite surface protein 3 n=1 Tax=Strongyloides venezuelensis TaxID=75913 RepID=A0A0K0EZL6_STRVS